MLDSCLYEVKFGDGHLTEYSANILAEYMYICTNDEGQQILILNEITNHKHDGRAVHKEYEEAGKTKKKTTRGGHY
jgi:hypothetical protein